MMTKNLIILKVPGLAHSLFLFFFFYLRFYELPIELLTVGILILIPIEPVSEYLLIKTFKHLCKSCQMPDAVNVNVKV